MTDPRPLEPVHLPAPAVQLRRWTWRLVLGAIALGGLSALAAALVRLSFRGLQWALTGSSADAPLAAAHLPLWRRVATPVVGALLANLVLRVRRQMAQGQEPEAYVEYVEVVRHREGAMALEPNLWRTFSAAFSVATGAAVGREGSMIQFAAAVASVCGRRFRLAETQSLALLVACGVAGGVTTAYNAPIAATFFAAEIVLGGIELLELPLLGLAAAIGWVISGMLLGRQRLYPVQVPLHWDASTWMLPLLALVLGVTGPAYQWLLGSLRNLRRLPLALLAGGAVVGCLSVVDPRVWGNGDVGLRAVMASAGAGAASASSDAIGRVLLLRLSATFACVWTGTVGGVFTPTLFAGGSLGALLAHGVPGGSTALWGVAGMSFFLAAVTHAPLMAAFMAVELTGRWELLPILLSLNFLSWTVAHRISPRAMYAIASQNPENGGAMYPRRTQRVQ